MRWSREVAMRVGARQRDEASTQLSTHPQHIDATDNPTHPNQDPRMNQLNPVHFGSDTLPTMPQAKKPSVVGAHDAKNKFSQLLDRVSKGEVIVISRRGVPVANLIPYRSSFDREDAMRAAEEMIAARKGVRLPPGMTIKSMIEAGRQ